MADGARRAQNKLTHTAGVPFKLLERINFLDNIKKRKVKASKKSGRTDFCLNHKSLTADKNNELIDLDRDTGRALRKRESFWKQRKLAEFLVCHQ